MPDIDLIPVIELPRSLEAWDHADPRPEGNWRTNPSDWEKYWSKVNVASGYSEFISFPFGSGLYPVANISMPDLARLIELHLSDTPFEESCAFFGGYVLLEDERPILMPQCCGTLADISTWQAITRPEKFSEAFCLEGHPCPEAISDGEIVKIQCNGEDEPFDDPAPDSYVVNRESLVAALNRSKLILKNFTSLLNEWGAKNGRDTPEKVLIFESQE